MNQHRKKLIMFLLTLCIIAIGIVLPSSITAKAAKVKLNKESVTIAKSKSITLKLKGTKKKVKWSTNNKKVATVTQKGKVTGKKVGTAKIVARVGKKKYVCKVQVVKTVNDIPVVLNETNCYYTVKDGVATVHFIYHDTPAYGYDKYTSIVIPSTIAGYPVKVVSGFGNYKKLTEVVISKGVTTLEDQSFQNCPNLKKLVIPNSVTEIEGHKPGYVIEKDERIEMEMSDGRTYVYIKRAPVHCPVFEGDTNLTIYGYAGSFAEECANKEGIPFKAIKE